METRKSDTGPLCSTQCQTLIEGDGALATSSLEGWCCPFPPPLSSPLWLRGLPCLGRVNSYSDVAWPSPDLSFECKENQTTHCSSLLEKSAGWKSYLFILLLHHSVPPSWIFLFLRAQILRGTWNSRILESQDHGTLD